MSALLEQTKQRILDRVSFDNPDVEQVFQDQTSVDFSLAIATVNVENKAIAMGLDPIIATNAVVGLAQLFGESFPTPGDRKNRIIEFVNELVDDGDPEFEALLETYFAAYLEFEAKINENNQKMNDLLSANTES